MTADEPVEYEYMTRKIMTHLGEALLTQAEIKKWSGKGWELHQQSQGISALDGGPMTLLTFRRPKSPGNEPIPSAGCGVLVGALVIALSGWAAAWLDRLWR